MSEREELKSMRAIGLSNAMWAYKLGYVVKSSLGSEVKSYHKDSAESPSFEEVLNGTWWIEQHVTFN